MKPLLIIDNLIPFLKGRLENDFECRYVAPADITPEALAHARGLLVRTRTRCDAPLLGESDVEFVATGTIGLDHFNIPWLESRGIDWHNAPGCNAPAVAQYVWTALLNLGFDPARMTLGVVGKGHVGSIVTEWGRHLGAKVIVCDPPRKDKGFDDEEYLELHDLMRQADAVTFHTPLIRTAGNTPDTSYPTLGLADAKALSGLCPGAILVNAARGGIVDEEALLAIKESKRIKTAIDTWDGEPAVNRRMLDASDIATFHIAGYSQQGKERATHAILSNLENHFGVSLPKDHLAGTYRMPAGLSRESILDSYDIYADDAEFRRRPEDFEVLRDTYHLRHEVADCQAPEGGESR
ncbi:MAG: 4-phosphoerythronate dehydrogenase [Muribaculaceae bacterium]|nr:4-phosphoerythronate dehydrogenase [Muribaculaceae bacterium]MDE6559038.1 4-phosphoerythronate dehydrogenase [Muribaculaceae bacterium]